MPRLCVLLANPYVAGLILAAPYGAVMSTVSGFLLIVASGLVRDVYQRFLRPSASEGELAWASYGATALVGVLAAIAALRPPEYLQLLIVFSGASMASAFLIPALMGCFWRRASAPGAIASMSVGVLTTVSLYAYGVYLGMQGVDQGIGPPPRPPAFGPYYWLGLDPCVWGLTASLVAGVVVSLMTRPPDHARVALLFDLQPPDAVAPATAAIHPETFHDNTPPAPQPESSS
jgi:SSS family solute:Na+ symporter/sodium/pantothenate symporter